MTTIEASPVITSPPTVALPVVTADRTSIGSPIGWSAIFAGGAIALGAWLVLHVAGIGIGLIAIDPEDTSTLRRIGIGTGIWSLIAPLIALFIGGWVAGRLAPTINTANAVIHGAVVWALAVLVATMMTAMMLGAVVRGATVAGSHANIDVYEEVQPGAAAPEIDSQKAQTTGLKAAEATGTVLVALAIVGILGLGAALLGSALAVRHERRAHVILPRATVSPTVSP